MRDEEQRAAIRQIEADEWEHRRVVLEIMRQYDVPISRYMEVKYYLIGRLISAACYVIARWR